MMIPSIDLRGGSTVQLVGGEEQVLEAGDPEPFARRFSLCGEVAVVDLDAALGTGDNRGVIETLLPLAKCRVGGGIRDLPSARRWLDAGAAKIVLGTAAIPRILAELPRQRVIAALDAKHGEVVVRGWRQATGRRVEERIAELADLVGGFLVTFVEREGRMGGIDLEAVERLVKLTGPGRLTVAGGVTRAEEIARLDAMGVDAQIGMALYTHQLSLSEAFAAPLVSDRDDGLWPTVVEDERGTALGLAWSNGESLSRAMEQRRGVYWSRRRGLWEKGATSGNTQELLEVAMDCDRDALRFTVRQHGGGFCHRQTYGCFGEARGLTALTKTLEQRRFDPPPGSYTARLFRERGLLESKIEEEAGELVQAASEQEIVHEAADLLYFLVAKLVREGVDLARVERELQRRSLGVTRRDRSVRRSEDLS